MNSTKQSRKFCQYLDLNTKIKANSRNGTKKISRKFQNVLNFFLCSADIPYTTWFKTEVVFAP